MLHPRRHRRALAAAGRGHGREDERGRGFRRPSTRLRRGERLRQGRQDHTELHRRRQQDGLEEILSV